MDSENVADESRGDASARPTASHLYCWANEKPQHGMATIAELLDQGYTQVGAHPRYRGTILMAKPCVEVAMS